MTSISVGKLPTTITIARRTYDILGFLNEGEKSVVGHVMVERAKGMGANLGKRDGRYILKHQANIPPWALYYNVVFVFPDWRHPRNSEYVYCILWGHCGCWEDWYGWLGRNFGELCRVLRRK